MRIGDNILLPMLPRLVGIWMGLAVALLGASAARARFVPASDTVGGRPLVAVVRARDADGPCQEIVTRIIAELMSEGVPVMALTCAAVDVACLTISDTRAEATVTVQRRDGVPGVEVRTGDTARSHREGLSRTGPNSVRIERLAESDSGGGPAALAVRTVELLRAMLWEGGDQRSPSPWPSPLPSETTGSTVPSGRSASFLTPRDGIAEQEFDLEDVPEATWVSSLPSAPMGPRKISVTIGVAMIGSFAGLDAAFGPTLRLGQRVSNHVDLSVFLAGPAFARDQQNIVGSVTVRQEMAALEADLLAMPWNGVVLRTGAGIGLYHIQVEGHLNLIDSALTGRSASGSSAALSWSAGIVANLRRNVGLFVDARVFVVTPTQVVLLNGVEVGRAGNPGLVVTSGIELRI